MIRRARLSDLDALMELIAEWTPKYPLRPDPTKIKEQLSCAILTPSTHYCAVSTAAKATPPTGCLIALQNQNLWAKKNYASIVMWVSQIPGDGDKMLRAFKHWADYRPLIRVAGFHPDIETDTRALALAERIGFPQHGQAFLRYKGAR